MIFEFDLELEFSEIKKEYLQLVYLLTSKLRDDWNINRIIKISDAYYAPSETLKWFFDNKRYILSEELPYFLTNKCHSTFSIAEKINIYLNSFPDNIDQPDDEGDILYEYKTRHCIVYGSTGTDIMSVYFGLNNGQLEMSMHNDYISFKYYISMDYFFQKYFQYNI